MYYVSGSSYDAVPLSPCVVPLKISPATNPVLGYAAAVSVVLIWAGWLVASRAGAQSSLTIYDLAALRYGVSAVVCLPVVLYFKPWQGLTFRQVFLLSFVLSPVYSLLVFGAFQFAPAAHGGVFMNGALPAITLTLSWLWLSEGPRRLQLAGIVLILAGTLLAVADGSTLALSQSWIGDLMFLAGAVFFSFYMILSRLWNVTITQVLLCSSIVNALVYLPIWWMVLPTGFAEAEQSQLILQTLYQGLIPGLVGLLLVAVSVRHIGASSTAAFMAAVPALGTVLSLFLLHEIPGVLGWASLAVLTPGILMVAVRWKNPFRKTLPGAPVDSVV